MMHPYVPATDRRSADDWREDAECRQFPLEVFFPTKGESLQPARSICLRCPVVDACLEATLAAELGDSADKRHGVFAGLSGRQRYLLDRTRHQRRLAAAS